jgi:hypothetical protein
MYAWFNRVVSVARKPKMLSFWFGSGSGTIDGRPWMCWAWRWSGPAPCEVECHERLRRAAGAISCRCRGVRVCLPAVFLHSASPSRVQPPVAPRGPPRRRAGRRSIDERHNRCAGRQLRRSTVSRRGRPAGPSPSRRAALFFSTAQPGARETKNSANHSVLACVARSGEFHSSRRSRDAGSSESRL